jgi:hypothetical protein
MRLDFSREGLSRVGRSSKEEGEANRSLHGNAALTMICGGAPAKARAPCRSPKNSKPFGRRRPQAVVRSMSRLNAFVTERIIRHLPHICEVQIILSGYRNIEAPY